MVFMVLKLNKVFGNDLKYGTRIGKFFVVIGELDLES